MFSNILMIIQFFFTVVMGLYFFNLLKSQRGSKTVLNIDSKKDLEKLRRLNDIKLTVPLCERTRPTSFNEIVGQKEGLKALNASLCGPNPQHVIIYGPPGVGKTAAARLLLKKAIESNISPFRTGSKFIEVDATTMRFDERNIADPLIGSVHDPIYQGAGAYGPAGIPQPKPGAVTKAHGGILFIDEIGELHPIQINKLLKVLEDRRVFFESAYYSSGDKNVPDYIHEVFKCGLPADFRLVGATTRRPEDIPEAIRSRCVEIFFDSLSKADVSVIAVNAAEKGGFTLAPRCSDLVALYASNGRDAVNIIQIAGSTALIENRSRITIKDIEWVLEFGRYSPRPEKKISGESAVGVINGLAVMGHSHGMVMDIEASAVPSKKGRGKLIATGIVESEEIDAGHQKLKRTGTARAALDNVMTVLKEYFGLDVTDYDIHLNFPGGMPVDGPSAGTAIMCAIYSAITKKPIPGSIAMTGEISIMGKVKPVGGVTSKIDAAKKAGVKKVIIPAENYQEMYDDIGIEIIKVSTARQVIENCFEDVKHAPNTLTMPNTVNILTAEGAHEL